jgi:SAM-dependent methyltransferase
MRSPWLDIPLADYEGHMALPGIGQADMLVMQFGQLLARWSPASAAVIGCAGGNGFDRVRVDVTKRLVGIDINPQYIRELAYRYAASMPGLELYVRDIQETVEKIEPVDLIYAALVLEYVEPVAALRNLKALCRPNGILATVLQLPADVLPAISESPFRRLTELAPAMHQVAPATLTNCASDQGFVLQSTDTLRLSSGKEFAVQVYQRAADFS